MEMKIVANMNYGRVLIPRQIREALNIKDKDVVQIEYKDGQLIIRKAPCEQK